MRNSGATSGSPERRINIFKFILAVIVFGTAIGSVHLIHALTLDRIVEYREISYTSPRWREELDGYRIAFITDIHTMPENALQNVVDRLNTKDLDLLLLGGDFSVHGNRYRQSIAILSHVQTNDGIFGVEGNHDDYQLLFAAMEANGMTPLSNSGMQVREGFFLAGLPDFWNRREIVSVYEAVSDASADDFILLLTHNPDVTMQQSTLAVDLVLSGHTHGGQISFFGIWAPYFTLRRSITDYGQHFMTGWTSTRDRVPVYVSNGTGDYYNIPRVFSRPQVIMLTMQHGETSATNTYSSFLLNNLSFMIFFFIAWNVFVFHLYGSDKKRAEKNQPRISEATLISYAFLLGGPGAYLSMNTFRHKTDKFKFKLLVPLSIIIDFAVLSFFAFVIRQDFIADLIRVLWIW